MTAKQKQVASLMDDRAIASKAVLKAKKRCKRAHDFYLQTSEDLNAKIKAERVIINSLRALVRSLEKDSRASEKIIARHAMGGSWDYCMPAMKSGIDGKKIKIETEDEQ
jgi:hypothetical protein